MKLFSIVRFAFWAVPFIAAVGVGIWSHSLLGILWGILTFFGLQLLVFSPLSKFAEDYEEKHPPKSETTVPDKLLQQIMFIAEVKNMLPFSHRAYLNRPKLYIQGRLYPGGGNLYAAGDTKLRKRIEFIEKMDSGFKIMKYSSGDWESLVASVYAQAEGLRKAMQDNDETKYRQALDWESNSPMLSLDTDAGYQAQDDSKATKAEILEQMCQLEGMFRISFRGATRLTYGESNIIGRKVNPLFKGSRVFPVSEDANEEEIQRWLNHPMINVPLPDSFVMSMAAQTPVPVTMMERILRKLLQEDYDTYWKMAEERIRSKK
jgi:hypothetical protein